MKTQSNSSNINKIPQRNTALAIYMLSITFIVASYSIYATQVYL
ncbi:hypothetical protein [Patiriisocius marinus]|nr:hypothetical protein [Patiriisocius marinus]